MKDKILSFLPEYHPWRNSILWFDCIGSTNDHAKELAQNGAPHGTVLIADRQTGGRGRLGRRFESPAGAGVYMSVILRPDCKPDQLMHLTCATAVAMCDAVEATAGFRPGIKWTNDLVFNTRKLGGILTELSVDPTTGLVSYAVVGVGINCRQKREDFPPELQDMAASLSMVSGKSVDREQLASAMICSFADMGRDLLVKREEIMAAYSSDCITIGKDIVLLRGDEKRYGHAVGLDAEGGLLVRFADGSVETVASGEVSVRGMYGYA